MNGRRTLIGLFALVASVASSSALAAAGRTPTAHGVSTSGEAQYSIPIFAPKGTKGMVPQLALSYSHRSGGMLFGEGWSLGGLSQITVCPKTWAQDGQARAVWLDGNDRFCLDGAQLKLEGSGTYGANGSIYWTEIESYSKVMSYGVVGNTPDYFSVQAKDGLIYDYGSRGDTRIESLGSTTAHTWALTTIRDRVGNRIEFYYTEDATNGSFRPASVTWTTNSSAGVSPSYQIAFVYETQPALEIESGYVAGGLVRDVTRATQINVTHSGTLVRRYNLAYESTLSSTAKSRLASVTECAGSAGTDCLPATSFTYQNGTPGLGSQAATGFSTAANSSVMTLDVNGDGRSDLVYSSSASSGSGSWMVAFGNGTSSFSTPINTGVTNNYFDRALPIDYNGDGREDFLVPYNGSTWWVVLGTTSGLAAPTDTGIPVWSTAGNAKAIDINGDGLEDLVEGDYKAVWFRPRELSGSFGSGQYLVTPLPANSTLAVPLFSDQGMRRRSRAPDFNGDGHGDFAVTFIDYDPGTYQWWYGTSLVLANAGLMYGTGTYIWGLPVYADINGDGYTDIAFNFAGQWWFMPSLGTGLGAWTVGPAATNQTTDNTLVMDWDGDGYEDLVVAGTNGNWQLIRSTGETLSTAVNTSHYFGNLGAITVGDYNGDNLDDILYTNAAGNFGVFPHAGVAPDLLDTATDGYGNVVNFDYMTLAQGAYTKYSDATFPYQDFQGSLYVVNQYTAANGIGGAYTMYYWYYGAWVHRQGRGFMGFAAQRPYDSRTGINDYHFYRRPFPYTGLEENHHPYTSAWTLISQDNTVYTYDTLPTSGGGFETRYAPYSNQSSHYRYELEGAFNGALMSVATGTRTHHAATGLITDETVTTTENAAGNGLAAGQTWTVRTYIPSFLNDTTNWCIGRPQTTQEIRSHSGYGGATQTRTAGTTWSGTYCRPTETRVEPGDPSWQVTTGLEYDAFGNLWRETVTGVGMTPSRVSTTTWGTTGQHPHVATNAAGEQASQAWNLALGVPSSKTDPNGLTVSLQYDDFGRKTRETRPDGTYSETDYTLCPGCGSTIKLRVRVNHYGVGAVALGQDSAYLDLEDRPKYEYRWIPLVSAYSMVTRSFDSRGRVYTESIPYLSSASPFYQTRQFDLLDRVTSTSRPISASNSTLQYTYTYYEGFRTREVDAEGKQKTAYSNAGGKQTHAVDHNGYYQAFEFDAFGNPVRVMDQTGNVLQTGTYNVRGLRTASTDIDMGSWGYSYNALGEMSGQTDAKGQSTAFSYDLVGRKTLQTEPTSGGTLTREWTYGTSSANKNVGKRTFAKVSGPGITTYWETSAFDSLGRPSSTEYYNGSSSFYFDYSYSATSGLLDTTTYPTSTSGYRFKVQHDYQGLDLWRVRDFNAPGTVFWQSNGVNAALQVNDESLGNGLRTTRQYDAVNGLPDWIRTGPGGGTTTQNLNYAWDKVGNLKSRNDAVQSLTEAFTYDDLHRLGSSTLNGTTNLTMGYNQYGNITSKSDVGSYTYGTSRIHAVTAAGGNSYAYDANGNIQTKNGAAITWTASNKPKSISNGSYTSTFDYSADDQYWRQIASYSNGTETSLYFGGLLEVVNNSSTGITAWRHQVKAGGRTVAVYSRGSNGATNTIYPLADHLGSTEAITNSAGAVLVRESFTAFGKRRGTNWTGSPTSGEMQTIADSTRRGFTEHTMLDNIGLVHMNGRVYDPDIGRFLSADPYIQFPDNTQSWNRYSYVLNNPLSNTDPTGYFSLKKFFKKWIGTIVNVAFTVAGMPFVGGLISSAISTAVNGGKIGDFLKGAAIGAVVGAVAGPVGNRIASGIGATGSGMVAQVARGAIVGGLTGGVASSVSGGSFWDGAAAGGLSGGLTSFAVARLGASSAASNSTAQRIEAATRDVYGKVWTLPNTVVGAVYGGLGHAVGWAGYHLGAWDGRPGVHVRNNAIEFTNNPFAALGGITIGNTIAYGSNPWDPRTPSNLRYGYDDNFMPDHERQHTYQAQLLGPLYLPSNIVGGVLSVASGGGWHGSVNWNERGPSASPPRPW